MSGDFGRIPRQCSSVVATCRNINLWASSHDEKCQNMPINTEWKLPLHFDEKFMGVHKPRLMGGGKGNIVSERLYY